MANGFRTPRSFPRGETVNIDTGSLEQDLYKVSLATDTIDARAFGGTEDVNVGPTKEQMITAAIQYAASTGKSTVFIPASMLPYNASLVTFNNNVRIIIENSGLATVIDVSAFGAIGNGVADDTIPLNQALASGLSLDFRGRIYKANNLIGSTQGQRIYSSTGITRIIKNANGPLFTHSGDQIELENLRFEGDSPIPVFTGDNIVLTGNFIPRLRNCGSRYAFRRALVSAGPIQIIGTCDIYQTADASATGWDIEIGTAGVASLYSHIVGIYSSQNTGGILLTDVGETDIVASQFGKLSIINSNSPAAGPAGTGGGKTVSNRILGPIVVQLSGASFIGNHRGANATVTFTAGTSGCEFQEFTNGAGAAVTNNGNATSNLIMRNIATGASGTCQIQFGDDTTFCVLEVTIAAAGSGTLKAPKIRIINNQNYNMEQATAPGTIGGTMGMSATDNLSVTNLVSGKSIIETITGAGTWLAFVNGNTRLTVDQFGPKLPTYTVATRPAAADGTIIYVSDGGAGAVFQGRAGGAWVNLG